MRGYFLTNMYLSPIQRGIQCAHTVTEMFLTATVGKYSDNQHELLSKWAFEHKTKIVLNGGFASNLYDFEQLLNEPDNSFPWASFRESDEALNGAITCVGLVLPEKIYQKIGLVDQWNFSPEQLSQFEHALIEQISSCPLA